MGYPWAFFGPRTRFDYNTIPKYTEITTIYLESTRCFGTVLPSGNMSQCVCGLSARVHGQTGPLSGLVTKFPLILFPGLDPGAYSLCQSEDSAKILLLQDSFIFVLRTWYLFFPVSDDFLYE
jgi:hypothetical protein